MPANDRPPSYQWYPRDFAASMHKYRFSDSQELAYRRALDASFEAECYGVGTPAQWIEWGGIEPDTPAAAAFVRKLKLVTMECADGTLVQVRQAYARMEQALFYAGKVKAGRSGGLAKASNARAEVKQSLPSASASASAVEEESTPKDLLTAAPRAPESNGAPKTNGNGHPPTGEESLREWLTGFPEFWEAYPRKVNREAALKAYSKLRPRNDDTFTLLFRGLKLHKANEWAEKEPEFIPHASTWLNQGRFRDAEQPRNGH